MPNVITPPAMDILKDRFSSWPKKKFDTAIEEYQKFFLLAGKVGLYGKIPVNADIDQIWHICILNTKEYAATCNKHFGRFLHHEPILKKLKSDSYDVAHQLRWLCCYHLNYGNYTEDNIVYWPHAHRISSQDTWSIERLNSMLSAINLKIKVNECEIQESVMSFGAAASRVYLKSLDPQKNSC